MFREAPVQVEVVQPDSVFLKASGTVCGMCICMCALWEEVLVLGRKLKNEWLDFGWRLLIIEVPLLLGWIIINL